MLFRQKFRGKRIVCQSGIYQVDSVEQIVVKSARLKVGSREAPQTGATTARQRIDRLTLFTSKLHRVLLPVEVLCIKTSSHILAWALEQEKHSLQIMSLTNALPEESAKAAKLASHVLATLPTSARNIALTAIHAALSASKDEILAANARDLELAHKAAENGELSLSVVSRLDLGKKGKWEDMLKGILDVRELDDPGKFAVHLLTIDCR